MLVWLSEPFKLNMDKITYLGIEIAKKCKYEANVQLCRTRLSSEQISGEESLLC